MYRRLLLFPLLLGLLAACGPFGADTPTALPAPTASPTAAAALPTAAPPTPAATDTPQALIPATDTPLALAPATDTPLALAPATDTPQAQAPATDTPAAAAPATATPVAEAPATATPPVTAGPAPTAEADGPATATALAAGTEAPTPTAAASVDQTVLPATLQQLATIESEAATLRGLKPKAPVPAHFISSAQMQINLTQDVATSYSHEEARRDAVELWLLRLIDSRSIDLYQVQIDLLGEQVLGYYDPERRELFVRDDQQPLDPEAQDTLAHEYVHSLQDQYFDLKKLRPKQSHNNDRDTAVTGLIEGDAVLSQVLFAQRYMSKADFAALIQKSGSGPTTQLNKAPKYIQDSLTFPYDQGAQFVLALYQNGGYAAIDNALRNPPDTTEQILHPEKYLDTSRDEPLPLTLTPLTSTLGAGWTLQDTNTLGEFDLTELLRLNGVDQPSATAGWGASRYALYNGGANSLLLLSTRWDTVAAGNGFDTALRQSLAKDKRDGSLWTDGGRYFGESHTGDRVIVVSGTDRDSVTRALAAAK